MSAAVVTGKGPSHPWGVLVAGRSPKNTQNYLTATFDAGRS